MTAHLLNPQHDAEHWRRMGIELVMRRGSPQEVGEMRARIQEVLDIHRQTDKWLSELHRSAA